MLIEENGKLEERIIEALATQPAATALWLQAQLERSGSSYSLQAIYQELRKLQRSGIVLKTGTQYNLRLGWIVQMVQFTERMYQTYLTSGPHSQLLPTENERLRWRFHDLQHTVSFTTQLGLAMLQANPGTPLFESAPHIWYHLAHDQAEAQFINAVELGDFRYYSAVCGDTYLDQSYKRYFDNVNGAITFGQSPVRQTLQDRYLYIVGDYYSEVRLDKALTRKIDQLFASTRSAHDVNVGQIAEIFHGPATIRVQVEHNAKKAQRLSKQFRAFFGLKKQ